MTCARLHQGATFPTALPPPPLAGQAEGEVVGILKARINESSTGMSPNNALYLLEGRQAAPSSSGDSSLSAGAIAGIAVAATAAAAAAAGAGLLVLQRRRRRLQASGSEAGKASEDGAGSGMVNVGWSVPPSASTGHKLASWHSSGAAGSHSPPQSPSHAGNYAGVLGGIPTAAPPPWTRTSAGSAPPSSSPNTSSSVSALAPAPSWQAVQSATLYHPARVPASPFAAMAVARAKSAAAQLASAGSAAPGTATYAPHGSAMTAGGQSGHSGGASDGLGSAAPSGGMHSSAESRMLPELAAHVADVDAAMRWGEDEGEVRLHAAASRCMPPAGCVHAGCCQL